jgi:hypothetical protein
MNRKSNPLERLLATAGAAGPDIETENISRTSSSGTDQPLAPGRKRTGRSGGVATNLGRADAMLSGTSEENVGRRAAGVKTDSPFQMAEEHILDVLIPIIEEAKGFADRWPAQYQADVFRLAIGRLIDHGQSKDPTGKANQLGPSDPRPVTSKGGGLSPTEKLARALSVDIDALERSVNIDENGKVTFLGRFEGVGKRELQTRYSIAFLYVKEIALGNRMVDITDLRALCVEQGCYDMGNFTGNFKKDVAAGLIREQGEKGSRSRRYMLSQRGVVEGSQLLRTMIG